jgi:Zn-dependent protease with chaperone function
MKAHGAIRMMLLTLLLAPGAVQGQTAVKPGFNMFTVQQDIDIGRQSAGQIEGQLPMVATPAVTQYISRLGSKLAAYAPGAKYPYQFKVVNLSDINAFALPGGYVYIHRGLIERARTEGELAGVMAHEISHVALRHQTNQVSKAYLAQTGVGILGGLFGSKSGSSTRSIVSAVGGFGLNSLFLKNSRSAEEQADIAGAQIMAKAGYDPMDMARFFDVLRQEAGGNPSKLSQFFSDHPAPANRATRIRREATLIGPVRSTGSVGNIETARTALRRMPAAPTMAQVAARGGATTASGSGTQATIEAPSSQFRVFRHPQGFFEMVYPNNWRTYGSSSGLGVTIAPTGGIVQDPAGRQRVVSAVMVNHYVPFDGAVGSGYRDPQGTLFGRGSLDEATSDLVRQIMSSNPHLKLVSGSARRGNVSGQSSLSVQLAGTPANGAPEKMTVYTRELPDGHVVYVLALAPSRDYGSLQSTFDRMVRSLVVNDQSDHG